MTTRYVGAFHSACDKLPHIPDAVLHYIIVCRNFVCGRNVHGQAVYKISRDYNLHKNDEQQTKQRLQEDL